MKVHFFLDEINSISPIFQGKLLRAIQENKIYRVGDNKQIDINPRIISSINIDIPNALKNGILRPDLFYRLAVVLIEIPSLKTELRI